MSQPPPIPPYSPRPGNSPPVVGLWVGLVAGAAVSAIVWGAAWHPTVEGRHPVVWVTAILVAKFLAAAVLWAFGNNRLVAVGVFLSIPLGFLIFFGSCFAHLAR